MILPGTHRCSPRRGRFANRSLAIFLLALSPIIASLFCAHGAEVPVGQPPASGRDPGEQAERDWVDNRWSRTDIGPFLASNLELPGGRVAKGLSIKVGSQSQGSVAYDTASCSWRAAWTGGFLKVDPARFGLIRMPKVDGQIAFTAPKVAWPNSTVQYRGLHWHDSRAVLEHRVEGTRVIESPWLEFAGELPVFTRSMQIAAGAQPLRLDLAAAAAGAEITTQGAVASAVIRRGEKVEMIQVAGGGPGVRLEKNNDALTLLLPARNQPMRIELFLSSAPATAVGQLKEFVSVSRTSNDLESWLRPGKARWLPELKTRGQRGLDQEFLSVDTLTVPYENPWNALMFLAGVDFTSDGAAYTCSIHGDVWRVTGIDETLRELSWKRFATGLFQPLGLKVRDGQVFVLGRDQITRLHDENGDGEADFYENFSNLIETSTGGHDYVTSLEKDDAGNFYYIDPIGVHRISRDGRTKDILATGFRNANGLGVSPDGKIITAAPQQGEWTPSSQIAEIRVSGHYGYGGPRVTPERPLGYDLPLCWIPHFVDNSSGSQVWVPRGQWGPLSGQVLHLLWGRCGMMLVLRDQVDGLSQGAVVALPGRFLSGPNRGSFHPRDGHLYVAGSTGWQTSAVKDGALQRVRFTGKPVYLPIAWHAHSNGLTLTFTQPLERDTAEDTGSYAVHQWNYRYAAQYGSKDWSVANPEKEGRDEVAVKSARLSADGKTVFLDLGPLRPVMQMELKFNLNAADGKPLRNQLWLTLNRLDRAKPASPQSAAAF
ncbi:MAG: DUF6797 domain-containing protein [Verrucomicrobiota bacterium]